MANFTPYHKIPRISLKWIVCCLVLLGSHQLYSQVAPHEVKAAMILRFCENVTWQKPLKGQLSIGCFSDNEQIFKTLKTAEKRFKIQNAELSIEKVDDLNELKNFHAIYISLLDATTTKEALKIAREHNVLLISDNHPELLYVMINLVDHESKISFKVNPSNLHLAGFSIKPNLLLNGGSEVDIRTAYEKFENELKENRLKIEETEKALLSIEKQLLEKDKVIKTKELEIEKFEKEIEVNQLKFGNLVLLNEKEKESLSLKIDDLHKKEASLERIYIDISEKQNELKKLHNDIELLKAESNSLKNEVFQKDSKLNEQDDFISNQHQQILLYLSLIVALMIAAAAIARLFFIKKRNNKELEKKVNERTRELQLKNKQYSSLFDNAPSAIVEIDFSKALKLMHDKGIKTESEFNSYTKLHPEFTIDCLKNMQYIQTNNAHLNLFAIDNPKEISQYYAFISDTEALLELGSEFGFLLTKKSKRSYESVRYTKELKKINVLINWIDISDTPNSYTRVVLTIVDVTHLRKIESELRLHQEDLELLVKSRTDEIGTLNEELKSQNDELNNLNAHLEEEVNKRTANLKTKNDLLAAYAFKNAHNVRGPLARILGLFHLHEMKAQIPSEIILSKIGQEAKEMDLILRQISDELHENRDES